MNSKYKLLLWSTVLPSVCLAFLVGIPTACAGQTGPLASSITLTRTSIKESSIFLVTMVVSNTSVNWVDGVQPSALDVSGSGWAILNKWPKPIAANLAPGRSAKFSFLFKATLAGQVTLTGNATSMDGNSATNSSPIITISPKKTTSTAMTDEQGNAIVQVGLASISVNMTDEDSGMPISGLAVAAAQDKKNKGRAVVVIADSLGRYPLQFMILRGSATASKTALKSSSSVPVPTPVSIPVRSGSDAVFTGAIQLLQTGVLPAFVQSATDQQNLPPLILTVLKTLATSHDVFLPPGIRSVLPSTIKTETLPADEMISILQQKLNNAAPTASMMGLLIYAAEHENLVAGLQDTAIHLAPEFLNLDAANIYQSLGYTTLSLQEVDFGGIIFEIVVPAGTNDPAAEIETGDLQVSASGSDGTPLSGGSLELLSKDPLGASIIQVLDTGGNGNFPVPLGDHLVRVSAPGYDPFTNSVTVSDAGASISAVLTKKTVATATVEAGQATGFLPQGASFLVTPHFFDANGHEIQCTGDVRFYAHNPVGTLVATVDPVTGWVTMQGGCGAAGITAWCNGVESRRKLVSTDCNGTWPATPPPGSGPFTLTVGTSGTGTGNILVIPSSPTYVYGTVVTLLVGADPNCTFSHWQGGGTGSPIRIVVMNKNQTVTAVINKDTAGGGFDGTYDFTITVTGAGQTETFSDVVTIQNGIATADGQVVGTVDAGGHFTGTVQAAPGCSDPTFPITGIVSTTHSFTISGTGCSGTETWTGIGTKRP